MNIGRIEEQVSQGWINKQKHPTRDLYIYNYSNATQFESHWTDETRACRGLILDGQGRIAARPFPKFFNLDQLESVGDVLPAEPFEVFDKLDGSLGILYHGDGWQIATRGSFTSEQAQLAQQMFDAVVWKKVAPNYTLLFEIIHPQNRIVVDYGKRAELVLLAAVHTATGEELPYSELADFGFPVVKRFDGLTDFEAIKSIQTPNAEGFVIRFAGGYRVKVKFEEYKRLHRLLTGVTPRHIWEHLRDGHGIDSLIEKTPDEFHDWVMDVVSDIDQNYLAIEDECKAAFRSDFATRKDAAAYIAWIERTEPGPHEVKFEDSGAFVIDVSPTDADRPVQPLVKPTTSPARCQLFTNAATASRGRILCCRASVRRV